MTNENDMAFSQTPYAETYQIKDFPNSGLTKLEHFAAMAMQGLLSSIGRHDVTDYGDISHDAVLAGKALIAELNK